MRHPLLINREDIQLYPSLVKALGGVNLAIIVSAVDINIEKNVEHDGFQWSYINQQDLHKDYFPFWSLNTVARTVLEAEKQGFLISMRNPKTHWHDATKMYRVDHDKVNELLNSKGE